MTQVWTCGAWWLPCWEQDALHGGSRTHEILDISRGGVWAHATSPYRFTHHHHSPMVTRVAGLTIQKPATSPTIATIHHLPLGPSGSQLTSLELTHHHHHSLAVVGHTYHHPAYHFTHHHHHHSPAVKEAIGLTTHQPPLPPLTSGHRGDSAHVQSMPLPRPPPSPLISSCRSHWPTTHHPSQPPLTIGRRGCWAHAPCPPSRQCWRTPCSTSLQPQWSGSFRCSQSQQTRPPPALECRPRGWGLRLQPVWTDVGECNMR